MTDGEKREREEMGHRDLVSWKKARLLETRGINMYGAGRRT